MAPKVTIFFHKLAHARTNLRQKKKDDFLVTFSIGTHTQTEVPREIEVSRAHQTADALKEKVAKDLKKRHAKSIKRGVAQASKATAVSNSSESIQTNSIKFSGIPIGTTKVKQQGLTQIMIGSILINLVDVSFCMGNSIEVENNGLDFSKQKITKDPTSSLCTKLLNNSTAGSYTKYVGAEPVISRKPFKENIEGIESDLVRNISLFQGNLTKGFTSKPKSTRNDASTGFNFSLLNSYTFSNGINEWTSKEKEERRWECLYGLNTIRTTTAITGALRNKPKQYMRQVVCSKLHPVRKYLPYKCPSFVAVQSKSFIKCSSDSYHNVLSTNNEKTFPRKSVKCNDIESNSMSVFVIGTMSLEEQIEELQRKLAEKDAEVEYLTTQLAKQVSLSKQKQVEQGQVSITLPMQPCSKEPTPSTSIPHQELKALIMESIRECYETTNMPILGYHKPYPSHYDYVPYPPNYINLHFEKFDGINGSPKEHLAYFVSACGESAQSDPLLIRQFVQSLKGVAFTWYTQLPPGSIITWDDMQRAFIAQFVSSIREVTLSDLAETKQKPDESVNEFIARWRSVRLQCPEKLSELSAVQLCRQNLIPEIAVYLCSTEPETFNELVSKASNVEVQIARQNDMSYESMAIFVKYDKDKEKAKILRKEIQIDSQFQKAHCDIVSLTKDRFSV